jgi:hypothetical protein
MDTKQKVFSFKQLLLQLVISVLSMSLALWLFDATFTRFVSIVVAVLLVVALQYLLNPVFSWVAGKLGIVGILVVSLLSSSIIVWLSLVLVPGITLQNSIDGLFIGWVYALGLTIAQWVLVSQSDDILLAEILRKNRKVSPKKISKKPGFVFIQLDGVSWSVLDWQLKAGNLPNIARLLDEEGYNLRSWRTQLPSTTPASQAGILLGSNEGIPAFRWYEKDRGQFVVANKPEHAALIEKRLSNGKGLLADNGVSVGNLFSGDAATNIMVMSKLHGDRASLMTMHDFTSYFSSPLGFMRAVILSVGEMAKEVYQARRAEAQKITPRIKRHMSYILLRSATNVFLRSLQTTIVIQNMIKGVNSIYVDYLDYDEIAHHAGFARPESLAALSGLDQVVGLISRARVYAPRPYEVILVSDHGQAQGATFRQMHDGKTLEDYVAEFTGTKEVEALTDPTEDRTSLDKNTSSNRASTIAVTGSGNLGNIWLKKITGRATQKNIDKLYPNLIGNLLKTKGVGFLVIKSDQNKHICLSSKGSVELESGVAQGVNPLSSYGEFWQKELLRLSSMDTAPDIAVISSYDPIKGEVYAFEELVGSHGGMGGWQTEALLMHPKRFKIDKQHLSGGVIVGATTLHKVLRQWMK